MNEYVLMNWSDKEIRFIDSNNQEQAISPGDIEMLTQDDLFVVLNILTKGKDQITVWRLGDCIIDWS